MRAASGCGRLVGRRRFRRRHGGHGGCVALSSRLWVTDLRSGVTRELPATGAGIDPRPDPTGTWVAYAGDRSLHAVRVDGAESRVLGAPDHDDVAWGLG